MKTSNKNELGFSLQPQESPKFIVFSKLPVFVQVESYRCFHYLSFSVRTECRNFAPL